jgi:hypothetical protein
MHQEPIRQHKAAESHQGVPDSEGKGKSLAPPAFQLKASEGPAAPPPADSKSNSGGLPADLVSGFAATTGHDLSDVKVHNNSDKPAGVGALAFAQGNDIHLGAGQEQHLAHEAAHIVQQREGRVQATTQVAGMPVNDSKSLESEADTMGAKAMQMKGAGSEPAQRKAAHGATQFKAIQRKAYGNVAQLYAVVPVASQTARQWPAGVDLRVADNGHAVASADRDQKICYLDPWVIAQSNRELAARNSGITLVEQPDTIRGQAPNGGGIRTLKKILPSIAHSNNGGTGNGQSSWEDCGRMSREVMGPGGQDRPPGALVTTPGADMERTSPNFQPSAQFDNALVAAGLRANAVAARAAYRAMTPAQRQAFDRRHGLNRYAAPNVGEAFATQNANPNFNFHWGGVIATPASPFKILRAAMATTRKTAAGILRCMALPIIQGRLGMTSGSILQWSRLPRAPRPRASLAPSTQPACASWIARPTGTMQLTIASSTTIRRCKKSELSKMIGCVYAYYQVGKRGARVILWPNISPELSKI